MSSRLTDEERAIWADTVEQWRKSGKSAAAWCREHQLVYHQFQYWKDRLATYTETTSNPFIEITDDRTTSGEILLEVGKVLVRLHDDFDEQTLLRCMRVLRSLEC